MRRSAVVCPSRPSVFGGIIHYLYCIIVSFTIWYSLISSLSVIHYLCLGLGVVIHYASSIIYYSLCMVRVIIRHLLSIIDYSLCIVYCHLSFSFCYIRGRPCGLRGESARERVHRKNTKRCEPSATNAFICSCLSRTTLCVWGWRIA